MQGFTEMLGKKKKRANFNGTEVAMLLVLLDLGISRALLCYEVLLQANFFGYFIPKCYMFQ